MNNPFFWLCSGCFSINKTIERYQSKAKGLGISKRGVPENEQVRHAFSFMKPKRNDMSLIILAYIQCDLAVSLLQQISDKMDLWLLVFVPPPYGCNTKIWFLSHNSSIFLSNHGHVLLLLFPGCCCLRVGWIYLSSLSHNHSKLHIYIFIQPHWLSSLDCFTSNIGLNWSMETKIRKEEY